MARSVTHRDGPGGEAGLEEREAKVARSREGVSEALAVGPMMRRPSLGQLAQPRLRDAPRLAHLREAAAEHDGRAHALTAASSSDSSTRSAGTTTMARSTSSGIAPIEGQGGQALHGGARGIDREDAPGVAVAAAGTRGPAADLDRIVGSATTRWRGAGTQR